MRRAYPICVVVVSLAWALPARAQFESTSLGLEVGVEDFQLAPLGIPIAGAVIPIELLGSLYLGDHFELEAHVGAAIYEYRGETSYRVGLDVGLGFRYLFLEEDFRPYVGAELRPLFLFDHLPTTGVDGTQNAALGLAPFLGCEYHVGAGIRIGLKAQLSLYLTLQQGLGYGLGLTPYVSASF